MKKFNFKNFLAKRDRNARTVALLTEGLTDIKQIVFPHVDINSAVKFLRVMPGWKDGTLNAEIDLNFTSDKEIEHFHDVCRNEFVTYNVEYLKNGFQQDIKSSGGAVTVYELTKPETLPENLYEQFCSQMFATVMKFFKTKNITAPMRIIKRVGGKILITSDDAVLRGNTWKKIDDICGNKTISDGIAAVTAGIAEMKTTKDSARKEQLKPEMKKRGDDVMAALNAIQAESKPNEEDQAKIDAGTKTEETRKTVLYKGNIEECFYVYLIYLEAAKNDSNARMLVNVLYTGEQLRQIVNLNRVMEPGLTYCVLTDPYKKISDDFAKIVKFTGDVDETQRKLLQMFNTLVAPRPKDWAEGIKKQISAVKAKADQEPDNAMKAKLQQELARLQDMEKSQQPTVQQILKFIKDNHLGICIVNYLKKRAHDLKDVKDQQETAEQSGEKFDVESAMAKVRPDITQYGSLPEMFDAVMSDTKNLFSNAKIEDVAKEAEKQRKIEAMKQVRPQLKNPTAARRQKLFDAVKKLGGEVFADENWTASITVTAKQLAVFSRNKPKTEKDHKTILPGVNLEDGENITPDNKRIRDGRGPWIFDGLNKTFDTQETETCWCCAGSYCNHRRSIDGQTPKPWGHTSASNPTSSGYAVYDGKNKTQCLVQFMDNSNGRLFMLGNCYILDEADTTAGRIAGNDGGISTLRSDCERYPDFNEFIRNSGLWDRLVENPKNKVKSEADLMSEAIVTGIITADGEMHLSDRSQLNTYSRLIERVSKINITTSAADRFFADIFGETVIDLPPINCKYVKSADSMFEGVRVKAIMLENTENIETMDSMFRNTVTESIQGLNTRSAVTMKRTFLNCRQKVFMMINIPALDMRNCVNIDECFQQSYISNVNMQNTDNITSAKDAFIDMPLLQRIPDIKFKNVISPQQLRSGFTGDYVTIFDGCDKLLGGKKFDEEILNIEKFYQHPDRKSKYTDDRGYLILRGPEDANRYAKDFYKYPGVVLDKGIVSVAGLFNDIRHIKIRVLDVNGRTNLDSLFYYCGMFSIGAIIGAENVTSAKEMFMHSTCGICPKLNFPALRGEITVFKSMNPFGNVNSEGLFETGRYVKPFTVPAGNNYVESVSQQLFGDMAQEWRKKTVIETVVEKLYTSKIAKRAEMLKEQYKTGKDGFIEITDLADFSENLLDILEVKPKGIRFSKELVNQLNKMEELPEGIWNKARGKNLLNIPKLDLNGLTNASNLFKDADFGSIEGIAGLEAVIKADSMFKDARIGNLREILRGQTFAALKSASGMFRSFHGEIDIQNMKFPVLEYANAMFLNSLMAGTALSADFQSVTNAESMFYGCSSNKIQSVNLPNAVVATNIFANCLDLKSVGSVSLPRCGDVSNMFYNCLFLKVIGELRLDVAKTVRGMFASCNNLKNIHICRMGPNAADAGINVFESCPLREIYGVQGEPFFVRAKLLNR